jgi:hypothetical protein
MLAAGERLELSGDIVAAVEDEHPLPPLADVAEKCGPHGAAT